MTGEEQATDVRMIVELIGLSCAHWEKDAAHLQRVAGRSAATGLLDNKHLGRAARVEASINEEIEMVDDVETMVGPETAGQLGTIRAKLSSIRERVHGALQKMNRLSSNSRS